MTDRIRVRGSGVTGAGSAPVMAIARHDLARGDIRWPSGPSGMTRGAGSGWS